DLGAPGLDDLFGAGRMDIYQATINVLTTLVADNPLPPIGTPVTLNMQGPPNAYYVLSFSFNLGNVPIPEYQIDLDLYPPYDFFQMTFLDDNGEGSFSFFVPYNPAYSGLELHFQTWTDDREGDSGLILISLHETVKIL
ncbi:MAG: hypothetical protein KJ645_01310, partial [Planctomycetes bacterium]|nr:hypothetical protein [Planctomycetota bacterium]